MAEKSFYCDGKTAYIHEVTPEFHAEYLCFFHQGETFKWHYDQIELRNRQTRRLSIKSDHDARLDLGIADYEKLIAAVPRFSKEGIAKSELKLILKLAATGAIITAIVFFGVPIAARPLAYMTPQSLEANLSKSIEAQLDVGFHFCEIDNDGGRALQQLADKLSKDADTRFPVQIGIIETSMPNAFAMPAGKVYFTSGLIKQAQNGNEIAAVMAHEIAHVENRDVLVSLYRVMGFGIILDAAVGGGTGVGQQLIMLGANLTDLKNSRDTEAYADRRGMELLAKSNIDSNGMASFFAKLKKYEDKFGILKEAEFMSSHPDSGKRIQYSSQLAKTGNAAMTETEFQAVKKICN